MRGRVQGVGFRWFAKSAADEIGIRGYARNEADGRVQVYGVGTEAQLSQFAGRLHQGPRFGEVRGVEERDADVRPCDAFEIEG